MSPCAEAVLAGHIRADTSRAHSKIHRSNRHLGASTILFLRRWRESSINHSTNCAQKYDFCRNCRRLALLVQAMACFSCRLLCYQRKQRAFCQLV